MMAGISEESGDHASSTKRSDEQLNEIYKKLCNGKGKTIILCGERGVGKTWMAKKLSERATRDKSVESIQFTIWVYMWRKYIGHELCESIARQLSFIFSAEEWETKEDNKKDNEKAKEEERADISWDELEKQIFKTLKDAKFLLVLDGEEIMDNAECKAREADTMRQLDKLLSPDQGTHTILITREGNGSSVETLVKPLPAEESLSLLEKKMGRKLDACPRVGKVGKDFLDKCNGLPAKIILLAKVLNYFEEQDTGLQTLQSAWEEVSNDKNYDFVQLLCRGDHVPKSLLVDCCWSGDHFFRERGSVHCNELITYWMLEGYLGRIDSIEKAYEKGHNLLMDLIDCRVINELEAGYVVMNTLKLELYDNLDPGFGTTASLGLATVFESKSEGFGRIIYGDGIMKTVSKDKDGQFYAALFLDGTRYSGDGLTKFLKESVKHSDHESLNVPKNESGDFKKLEVLVLFNSTIKSLSSLLSDMKNLRVLVLRGCDFMDDIGSLNLPKLTVLEISGSSPVEDLPFDFFKGMTSLRTLNLSKLRIKTLPSLHWLKELRWLILRMCPNLKEVGSVADQTNLMVLDLSGSRSLERIGDKHFKEKEKLHTINLSNTSIISLPLIKGLKNLTHLFLSDCADLGRLRGMATLKKLKVLGLSNSPKFQEFHDQSLGVLEGLKILDLSGCSLDHLPANISNPHYLYLRSCYRLKNLLSMKVLKNVTVLDASGSKELAEIGDEFFKELAFLEVLNLSETTVKTLPSLSSLEKLRELILSHCASLEKLEGLNSLKNVEVIDLSYCSSLTDIGDSAFDCMSRLLRLDISNTKIASLPSLPNSVKLRRLLLKNCTQLMSLSPFTTLSELEELNLSGISLSGEAGFLEGMSNLRILDLSETKLDILPFMSKLTNLTHLYLRGCQHLKEVPKLAAPEKLEVLDLSGTAVSQVEPIQQSSNLHHLLLGDCSSIQDFSQLDKTALLGPAVEELPTGISSLTHLELLDLPKGKENQGPKTTSNLQECQNEQQWVVSSLPAEAFEKDVKDVLLMSKTHFLDLFQLEGRISFKNFHFVVRPIELLDTSGIKYLYKDELRLRGFWFDTRQFSRPQRSLEIRGFDSYPEGVEPVLSHTEFLYLIDNPFVRWLSDSDVNGVNEVMKVCWIERCNELERTERKDDAEAEGQAEKFAHSGDNLHTLWASSVTTTKSMTGGGSLQGSVFSNLKVFYLDSCPKLSVCFSAPQRLENLEILEVKFCAELKILFEDESAALPKLQMLYLWALPKLAKVNCKVPMLHTLKISDCPMLENLFTSPELPENQEKGDDSQTQVASSSNNLTSTGSGDLPWSVFNKLEVLSLDSCPKLSIGFTASQQLENLETLEVKYCAEMETLFGDEPVVLPKLQNLDLLALPQLKEVDCKVPNLRWLKIGDCAMLETLFSSSELPQDIETTISECPKLQTHHP